jgi:hypothetical protein
MLIDAIHQILYRCIDMARTGLIRRTTAIGIVAVAVVVIVVVAAVVVLVAIQCQQILLSYVLKGWQYGMMLDVVIYDVGGWGLRHIRFLYLEFYFSEQRRNESNN